MKNQKFEFVPVLQCGSVRRPASSCCHNGGTLCSLWYATDAFLKLEMHQNSTGGLGPCSGAHDSPPDCASGWGGECLLFIPPLGRKGILHPILLPFDVFGVRFSAPAAPRLAVDRHISHSCKLRTGETRVSAGAKAVATGGISVYIPPKISLP